MYAGESKAANSAGNEGPDVSTLTNSESGPALEVVELANGETIWLVAFPPQSSHICDSATGLL
jgi:hypothetical protein